MVLLPFALIFRGGGLFTNLASEIALQFQSCYNYPRRAMTRDKTLMGAAGEYYVAFRLAAEGYAVGLTAYGTRAIDLVVANPDTGKSITIQTKTGWDAFVPSRKYPPYWKWRVRKFTEHEKLFYAFVDLEDDPSQAPELFIVPSAKLPELLSKYVTKRTGRNTTGAPLAWKMHQSIGTIGILSSVSLRRAIKLRQ